MNIVNHFFISAKQYPNNIAFIENGKLFRYSEIEKQVKNHAAFLLEKGFVSGDNILVVFPVSVLLYINILAVFTIGANVVLTDSISDKNQLKKIYKKSNSKAILTSRYISLLQWILFPVSLKNKIFYYSIPKNNIEPEIATKEYIDTALISFTSGSTGFPKAANRTHKFLEIQLNTIIEEMKLTNSDVHITSFPVVNMCNLAIGATSIIPPQKKSQWKKIFKKLKPTIVSASPELLKKYIQNFINFESLRLVIGGATIFPNLIEKLSESIQLNKITLVYGSTEAEPIALMNGEQFHDIYAKTDKGIFVGIPYKSIELKILDNNTEKIIDSSGNVGEIIIKGPHVLENYYNDPEAYSHSKLKIKNEIWHRTGDIGYLLNDRIYFLGRKNYIWYVNEEIISPLTLEKFAADNNFNDKITWIKNNNKITIFYTGNTNTFFNLIKRFPFKYDNVLKIKKMPMDKRHQSRIDYAKLIEKYL